MPKTKADHTPGPWEVTETTEGKYKGWLGVRRVGTCEAVVYRVDPGTGFHMETHKADANLIAAAPELLQALENIMVAAKLKGVKFSGYLVDQANAAITKAKNG